MENACGQVRQTNGVRVLRWLGELDRFRLVLGCLGKFAELGETHHQPDAAENGWRHGQTQVFVGPFGWHSGEILEPNVNRALVLAAVVVRFLKTALRGDTKSPVCGALRDLHRASASREGLVQLV